MKRLLSILLAITLCTALPMAVADVDYASDYETALTLARNDLTNVKNVQEAIDMLQQLGGYEYAKSYVRYLQAVVSVQTSNADLTLLRGTFETLGLFDAFEQDLKERRFPSCQDLTAYVDARQKEKAGDIGSAYSIYSKIGVLDAQDRALALYSRKGSVTQTPTPIVTVEPVTKAPVTPKPSTPKPSTPKPSTPKPSTPKSTPTRRQGPGGSYDMGVPQIGSASFGKDQMNLIVFWVQTQLKATGIWYQGDKWDVTGNLGDHTMSEIAAFMSSRGYSGHSGRVDQKVINELAAYLGSGVQPVYVGGMYDHMSSILRGDAYGTMDSIVSNMRDKVARVTTGARWVQVCLKRLGYYNSSIDGMYGEGTENAVKKFQTRNGYQQRDYVSLGVARAMLEAYYQSGGNLNELP